MNILTILGQKTSNTGSGIVVNETLRCSKEFGDKHHLLSVSYANDFNSSKKDTTTILASLDGEEADVSHPIPGMSDAMPYLSTRYTDLSREQIIKYINVFRKKIDNILKHFKPDLIHIHHIWILVSLAQYYKIPVVITIHGTGLKLLNTAIQHKHFVEQGIPYIKHFFSVSRVDANRAISIYSIPENKISVIGNGYNERIFNISDTKIFSSQPIILYAGKFVEWKGLNYLLQACARITLPFKLVIVGSGPDEIKNNLMTTTYKLNLENHVSFMGQLSQLELAKWMRSATVFVLPSIEEPFGLVLLEALACGCPVIAANTGGPAEFVPGILLKKSLAELVPALKTKTSKNENNYVESIKNALLCRLSNPISTIEKEIIHTSVKNLTWESWYKIIRKKNIEILRH